MRLAERLLRYIFFFNQFLAVVGFFLISRDMQKGKANAAATPSTTWKSSPRERASNKSASQQVSSILVLYVDSQSSSLVIQSPRSPDDVLDGARIFSPYTVD